MLHAAGTTIAAKPPEACTLDEITSFCQFVVNAGEVSEPGLVDLAKKAVLLVFLRVRAELVGTAALKVPRTSYRARVFGQAGAKNSAGTYSFELGWVALAPSHRNRGFSRILVESALGGALSHNVFATTRADNEPMQKTLTRFGFQKMGDEYVSNDGKRQLLLFVRDYLAAGNDVT